MIVWIVMCNDYIQAVFTSNELAMAYIKAQPEKRSGHILHWRSYSYEVRTQ